MAPNHENRLQPLEKLTASKDLATAASSTLRGLILAEREIRTRGTFNSSHDFQVEKTWIWGALCRPGVRCVMTEMS